MERKHKQHISQDFADFLHVRLFFMCAIQRDRFFIAVFVVNVDGSELFAEGDQPEVYV